LSEQDGEEHLAALVELALREAISGLPKFADSLAATAATPIVV